MYDLAIVGAGPCGITAAIYSLRNKLNTLVLSEDIGGQMAWSGLIENYPAYSTITGPDLTISFEKHIKTLGNIVKNRESVERIDKKDNVFVIKTKKGEYTSKSVLIASGKNPKFLNIPGEEEFKNKGVVYCAICDGPLYSDKVIAIVGSGNSAMDSTLQMVNIAKHIYLISKYPSLKGDALMLEKIKSYSNVTIIYEALTKRIEGNKVVESIIYESAGKEFEMKVDGVFIQVGLNPNSSFAEQVIKNQYGEITINNENETNIKGLFAAGDVTNVSEKQIVIACGEGAKAALSIFKYLTKN